MVEFECYRIVAMQQSRASGLPAFEDRTMIDRLEKRFVLTTLTGTAMVCVVLTTLFAMALLGKAF